MQETWRGDHPAIFPSGLTSPHRPRMSSSTETATVVCPYCAEAVEVYVESDVVGDMVQDCEVCCNPWRMRVDHDETGPRIVVESLDE